MFVDTSAWVALRTTEDDVRQAAVLEQMDGRSLFVSPVQFGEMADIARRRGEPVEAFVAGLRVARLVPLTPDLALEGSAIKAHARSQPWGKEFSLIDGILLASARSVDVPFLTLDADFSGFDDCIVLTA